MSNKKTPNIEVETEVFRLFSSAPLTWGDIKHLPLRDNDVIISHFQEDMYESYYHTLITRMELESDIQCEKRLAKINKGEKAKRYKTFLKLKKEFEGNPENNSNPVTPE